MKNRADGSVCCQRDFLEIPFVNLGTSQEEGKSMKKRIDLNKLTPYLFIAPTIIGLLVFSYYSMGKAVFNSFTDKSWVYETHFVGLKNYIDAFKSEAFMKAFSNQVIVVLARVFNHIFWPILAAELLFFVRHAKLQGMMKRMFVIPMLVPGIVGTMIWKYLYNPNYGINVFLESINLGALAQDWLNNPSTAMFAVLFAGFPFISGLYFLIFHSALNSVDRELYEAALIDGATSFQVITNIHIPNLMPYVRTVATLSLIGALGEYAGVAAMTGGGPGYATTLPALWMYRKAFSDGEFGAACAMGIIVTIEILIFTLIFRKFSNKEA